MLETLICSYVSIEIFIAALFQVFSGHYVEPIDFVIRAMDF